MVPGKIQILLFVGVNCSVFGVTQAADEEVQTHNKQLLPLLAEKCVHCHGADDPEGQLNLEQWTSTRSRPDAETLDRLRGVLLSGRMPPADEERLTDLESKAALDAVDRLLPLALANSEAVVRPIRRLNRFQYNNAVRDLFQLNRDVFALPEKLMTRHSQYLAADRESMPDVVEVSSLALNPVPGLQGVAAYPRDLRAAHGFDNQANQLTLSPLLLDAFLRLSVSIFDSPDFNRDSVGIWDDFFEPPTDDTNPELEISSRLRPFLQSAFRGTVPQGTVERYSAYATRKLSEGLTHEQAMKKVASAVLSSPMFLYRADLSNDNLQLATDLSFFLWASIPDDELLQLAVEERLREPKVLRQQVRRMLADPRAERFLDTFPGQWMQLDNVLAATPDPDRNRFFSLIKTQPASLQMLLEPLLLFDSVFVENRPVTQLVMPDFGYRSELLQAWYETPLKPPRVDFEEIAEQNRVNDEERAKLNADIDSEVLVRTQLLDPAIRKILEARNNTSGNPQPVDLKPWAAWEFDGDLKSSVNDLPLKASGKISFEDSMVVLKGSYLQSPDIDIALRTKTLEVWCVVSDLSQRGGGVMGTQGPGDFFDTIVLGERKPRHWISGSNGFSRTDDFPESTAETETEKPVHLVMVYRDNGDTLLYRNGVPYGKPFNKGRAEFPAGKTSILFGLRHLPAGGNRYLNVKIDRARLYNRALTPQEVAASFSGHDTFVSDQQLRMVLSPEEWKHKEELDERLRQLRAKLAAVPVNRDPIKVQEQADKKYDRQMETRLRSRVFRRQQLQDPRYGGIITNAATMSMTSGPTRTHPIARGAWVIEVILNDPPPPPPNDIPPLNEDSTVDHLTIREKFAQHRSNPDCAGCHARLDPLGFALENFDITGRWRDRYENGRKVNAAGRLWQQHRFQNVVEFKRSLMQQEELFVRAFTAHLMRFALERELTPRDTLSINAIMQQSAQNDYRLRELIEAVVCSDSFLGGSTNGN